MNDRRRRLAAATTRTIRPGTQAARDLDAADDAFWDAVPPDERMAFRDLLRAFVDRNVRFLVVGAYALAVLGRPRATDDLDVWIARALFRDTMLVS